MESPTPGPSPMEGGPVAEDPIPGVGSDVFIAGGLTRVSVPEGWTLLARGDRADNPGGYSESAVLANRQSGVTLGVYLLAGTANPADAILTADAVVREWTRDGREGQFDPAQEAAPFGAVAGAASARYRYVRGSALEGEVVVAIRQDGATLVVFVDAGQGALDAAREVWQPLRDAVLNDFGA